MASAVPEDTTWEEDEDLDSDHGPAASDQHDDNDFGHDGGAAAGHGRSPFSVCNTFL
jgi:hypothetical protein